MESLGKSLRFQSKHKIEETRIPKGKGKVNRCQTFNILFLAEFHRRVASGIYKLTIPLETWFSY